MSAGLDTQKLKLVFQSRPDILDGIKRAADTPSQVSLFNDIAGFVHDQLHAGPEPALKRRRVDDGPTNGFAPTNANGSTSNIKTQSSVGNASDEPVLLEIKEISVSVPQRKKYDLCFTKNHLYARAPGTTGPVQGIVYAWKDIEYAFYLPVPEKSQVQHNYILFPRGTCLPAKGTTPTEEPLVFTVPATPPKQGTIAGPNAAAAAAVADSYEGLFNWALTRLSAPGGITSIVAADPQRFHSVVRQPHRPGEKAVHVKAFRGSKDGYLFFLENGILWGYKKPLLFIPLDRIAAVSYTSVLQRTFNVVVEAFVGDAGGDATEELEFAMLDQEDYPGIDEKYVKRNGLQDRSMAERRRAKLQLAENKEKKKGADGAEAANGNVEGDGLTELERAQAEAEQMQMEDDDEEDEEDYDPGSGGDSDGSGESEDDDDDDDDDEDGEGAGEGDGEAEYDEGDEGEDEGGDEDEHHHVVG